MVSEYRYFALGEESAWLTPVAAPNYIDFLKEGLSSNRSLNKSKTAGFMESRSQSIGKFIAGGPLDCLAVPDEMGHIMRMMWGVAQSSTQQDATAAYKHIFLPQDVAPFYTAMVNKDGLLRRYVSTVAKKQVIKIVPGMDVQYSVELLAAKEDIGSKLTPSFTQYGQPLHFSGFDLSIATADNSICRSLEITHEIKIDEEEFDDSTQFRKGAHRSDIETSYKLELEFPDEDEIKRFYNGTTGTEPGDVITPFGLVTTLTGVNIESTYDYELVITTPQTLWHIEQSQVTGRENIIQKLTGATIHDVTQTSGTKVELTNRDTDLT